MSSKKPLQYTIRGIGEQTDRLLREKAAEYGTSLNETAVKLIEEGVGIGGERVFHDLDAYAGSWVTDPECEEVLEKQRQVDEDLWK